MTMKSYVLMLFGIFGCGLVGCQSAGLTSAETSEGEQSAAPGDEQAVPTKQAEDFLSEIKEEITVKKNDVEKKLSDKEFRSLLSAFRAGSEIQSFDRHGGPVGVTIFFKGGVIRFTNPSSERTGGISAEISRVIGTRPNHKEKKIAILSPVNLCALEKAAQFPVDAGCPGYEKPTASVIPDGTPIKEAKCSEKAKEIGATTCITMLDKLYYSSGVNCSSSSSSGEISGQKYHPESGNICYCLDKTQHHRNEYPCLLFNAIVDFSRLGPKYRGHAIMIKNIKHTRFIPLTFWLMSTACSLETEPSEAVVPSAGQEVINGNNASRAQIPSTVFMYHGESIDSLVGSRCSATKIGDDLYLTAAHCLLDDPDPSHPIIGSKKVEKLKENLFFFSGRTDLKKASILDSSVYQLVQLTDVYFPDSIQKSLNRYITAEAGTAFVRSAPREEVEEIVVSDVAILRIRPASKKQENPASDKIRNSGEKIKPAYSEDENLSRVKPATLLVNERKDPQSLTLAGYGCVRGGSLSLGEPDGESANWPDLLTSADTKTIGLAELIKTMHKKIQDQDVVDHFAKSKDFEKFYFFSEGPGLKNGDPASCLGDSGGSVYLRPKDISAERTNIVGVVSYSGDAFKRSEFKTNDENAALAVVWGLPLYSAFTRLDKESEGGRWVQSLREKGVLPPNAESK